MLPEGIAAAPRGYGAHVDAALGADAHHGMSRQRFEEALLLWDEGMADRAARFLGEHPDETLVVLAGILVLVGVYPTIMAPLVESGAQNILALLGGA